MSKIEWTEATWNPMTGCSKHSLGCQNCYAERMAKRLQAMGQQNYVNGFIPTFHEHMLNRPLFMKKPKMIFVNSMSDTFHDEYSDKEILKVFQIMNQAYWHTFQVLTKRSDRLLALSTKIKWTRNIWMGVTVENTSTRYRIEDLRLSNVYIKFLSIEPLLGRVRALNLNNIDWVIVGGESGPNARPIKEEWVLEIRDACNKENVPFFFKQWGGKNKKKTGRLLENRIWDEMPV